MAVIDLIANVGDEPLGAVEENFLYERVIDFSKPENQMVVGDTMRLFRIPGGMFSVGAKIEVLVVQGAAAFADLGITGVNEDEYIDGADMNALGVTMSGGADTPEPVSMSNNGRYINSEEIVSLLALGSLNAGKIRVQIFGFDLRSSLED